MALVDLDLQFGDVAVMMNIHQRTIAELMQENEEFDRDLLETYLYGRNGVNVRCPQQAGTGGVGQRGGSQQNPAGPGRFS